MKNKCNQDAYAYLTQACAIAIEYLNQIDLVYNPNKRDKVIQTIKNKMKKAKRAQRIKEENGHNTRMAQGAEQSCPYCNGEVTDKVGHSSLSKNAVVPHTKTNYLKDQSGH